MPSAVLLVMAAAVPPIQSGDVWSYASYGRMVIKYHDSPYTHTPADYANDPIMSRTAPIWATQSSIYGPAWVAVSAPGTWLAGDSPRLNRLWFSVMAAAAVGMAMWLVFRETEGSVLAMALLGVNPFVVVSVVNGAHNDAVVGLAVLGATLLANAQSLGVVRSVVGSCDRHQAAIGPLCLGPCRVGLAVEGSSSCHPVGRVGRGHHGCAVRGRRWNVGVGPGAPRIVVARRGVDLAGGA